MTNSPPPHSTPQAGAELKFAIFNDTEEITEEIYREVQAFADFAHRQNAEK